MLHVVMMACGPGSLHVRRSIPSVLRITRMKDSPSIAVLVLLEAPVVHSWVVLLVSSVLPLSLPVYQLVSGPESPVAVCLCYFFHVISR